MNLSFLPLTLQAVDKVTAEALCLFVGEDERPLTGLAGLADWRLAGGLSRLLREGLLKGTEGEALLTPARRMPFGRLFLFGLGPLVQSEELLASRISEAIRKLASAGVGEAALQLPQRLSPVLGIRTLIDVVAPARAVVFGPDPAALVRALSVVANHGVAPAPERRVVKVPGPPPRAPSPHRPGPPERPSPSQRPQPPVIPKATPLPFTPSNAHAIRPRPANPTPAPGRHPAPPGSATPQGASAAGAGAVPGPSTGVGPTPSADAPAPGPAATSAPPTDPTSTAGPSPADAASPATLASGADQNAPARSPTPLPPESDRPPSRPPLPKTQRYVPPPPKPDKKKP
jgi:Cytosol aminopeptidase family, N-terminal domain